MGAGFVLFIFHVRLTTWLAAAAFLVVGRRDRRALLAGAAWLTGFETLFEITSLAVARPWGTPLYIVVGLVPGLVVVPLAVKRGVSPSVPLTALAVAFWLAWIATGFHVNHKTMAHLDPVGEVLNEVTKITWALAYLWPFTAALDIHQDLPAEQSGLRRRSGMTPGVVPAKLQRRVGVTLAWEGSGRSGGARVRPFRRRSSRCR